MKKSVKAFDIFRNECVFIRYFPVITNEREHLDLGLSALNLFLSPTMSFGGNRL